MLQVERKFERRFCANSLVRFKISGKSIKSMSYEDIAAQVFLFYIALNETSSSTVAYTLFELTQNKELMDRAQ